MDSKNKTEVDVVRCEQTDTPAHTIDIQTNNKSGKLHFAFLSMAPYNWIYRQSELATMKYQLHKTNPQTLHKVYTTTTGEELPPNVRTNRLDIH